MALPTLKEYTVAEELKGDADTFRPRLAVKYSTDSLSEEFTQVVDRIKGDFRPQMVEAIDREYPKIWDQIERAEEMIDREARKLQIGRGDINLWRRALRAYERGWKMVLRMAERADKDQERRS